MFGCNHGERNFQITIHDHHLTKERTKILNTNRLGCVTTIESRRVLLGGRLSSARIGKTELSGRVQSVIHFIARLLQWARAHTHALRLCAESGVALRSGTRACVWKLGQMCMKCVCVCKLNTSIRRTASINHTYTYEKLETRETHNVSSRLLQWLSRAKFTFHW